MENIERKLGSVFSHKSDIDSRLKTVSSTVLNTKIEFEESSTPYMSINNALKGKYVNLSSTPAPVKRAPSQNTVDDGEGLPHPKEILFPEENLDFTWRNPGGAGFMNCGNTCFLNATLQCLVHCPPLMNYMMTAQHTATCRVVNRERCILCNLQQLTKRSLTGAADSFSPKWFINNLNYIGRHFRNGRQEDAHEFLRLSLDKMQKCALFGLSHLDKYSKETTVINQIFGGFLRSQVVCLQCSWKSNTYDPLLDISLDIKNADSLQRAFSMFVRADRLEDDNAYFCQRCNKKVTAYKRFTIHKPPNVLTIQLKRFSFASTSFGGGGKITKAIKYPEKLDIRPYMSNKNGPPEIYSLFATIQHEGYSCNSGHYVANVRCGTRWIHFNDSLKRIISVNQCLHEPSAYILFYIKDKVPNGSRPQPNPMSQKQQMSNNSQSQFQQKNKFIGPMRPEQVKTGERPVFKPLASTPSNDIGKPVQSPFKPLSANREKIRINLGVKPLNKSQEQQKHDKSWTSPAFASPKQPSSQINGKPETPRLVMKIQGGKSFTIETSPQGKSRILSDDDEVQAKMNEKKHKKHKKRPSLVPYGDESTSDSDWSVGDSAKKMKRESTDSRDSSIRVKSPDNSQSSTVKSPHSTPQRPSMNRQNSHSSEKNGIEKHGVEKHGGILFDTALNATNSVPGNAHLIETVSMKQKVDHNNPENKHRANHGAPIKRQFSETLTCVTTPVVTKQTGGKEWQTTVESINSPSLGSSHSNSSAQSNNSTSEWSVSKKKSVLTNGHDRNHEGWTITPNKKDREVREKTEKSVPSKPEFSSPFESVSDKAMLLDSDKVKHRDSEEYVNLKKHKKRKKHKKDRRRDKDYIYSELAPTDGHSHKKKKKKKKHKERDSEREEERYKSERTEQRHKNEANDKSEREEERYKSERTEQRHKNEANDKSERNEERHNGEHTEERHKYEANDKSECNEERHRSDRFEERHKKKRYERVENGEGKRNRKESESSTEFEWVEKTSSIPLKTSKSAPGTPVQAQSWDHHITDGYKRKSSSGSSTPLKTTWDGLKTSRVAQELEKIAEFGYGVKVSGWDGGQSSMDTERQRDLQQGWKRGSDDEYDEEFDRGRVKKVKHKHVDDHQYSINHFQHEQDRRNKSKINWSTIKIGDNNPYMRQNSGSSHHNGHHHGHSRHNSSHKVF